MRQKNIKQEEEAMLKLSKISKVILIAGILVTFSCIANITAINNSFAQEAEQSKQKTKKQQKAENAKGSLDTKTTEWEAARDDKNQAQNEYTQASKNYNTCVSKGNEDCTSLRKIMDEKKKELDTKTEAYNKAQKATSDAYYENEKAQAKANKEAEKTQKKEQKTKEKALKDAKKALKNCEKDVKKGKKNDCTAEKDAVAKAQADVDGGINGSGSSVDVSGISAANVGQAYKTAQAECDHYSAMTSKDAQTKAREACAKAEALKSKLDSLNDGIKDSPSTKAAQRRLKSTTANMGAGEGQYGVVDISNSRKISTSGSGSDSLAGYRSDLFNYKGADGEVLDKVTRRAALTIVSLKPIIYIFAGFGLIAFAWMAIFNKLSWKWFANIAMGLFLVANMGRLIEYFVAGDGNSHYYIGKWNSATGSVGTATDGQNQLANAFKDSYYVYGDTNYNKRGVRNFFNEYSSGEVAESFQASTAGFCQGTSASGWTNFKNCMQDIVSTAKKVGDTVQTAKATVEDVVARAEAVKDNVSNIVQAAKAMEGASLTDIVANAGTILNNVNAAVSTTTGAVGSIQNGMSSIANNVQDMGKSRAQQQELNDRRASGEATNKFNAGLMGQEWNSTTGGVENVDGQYAGKDTGWSNFANGAANIGNKTAEVNNMTQDFLAQTQAVTNVVDNTSVNDLIGDWGQDWGNKTLNDTIQERANERKQEEKSKKQAEENAQWQGVIDQRNAEQEAKHQEYLQTNAGKNETYNNQAQQTSQLYSDVQSQRNEVNQLQQQKAQAQAQVDANCKSANDTSPMCSAAKGMLNSVEASLTSKQEQLKVTEAAYSNAKSDLEDAYKEALDSNIEQAQSDYDSATKQANDICKLAPSSSECSAANKKAMEAASRLVTYTNEKENQTGNSRVETKEDIANSLVANAEQQELKRAEEQLKYEQEQAEYRQNNEAAIAQQEYSKAMDEANTLYTQINAQEKEAKDLEEQAKAKQEEATRICGSNASSQLCATAQTAASAAKDAADNKKDQLNQSKTQYNEAKNKAEAAYNNAVTAGANQAQRDYDKAKATADEAQKQIADANAKMGDAKAAAETSKTAYDSAVKDANNAKSEYDQAVKDGASAEEIKKLKEEYEAKLKTMSDANKERQKAEAEYNELQKKKSDAERTYNDAYSKANEAADKKSSYTNESVNKTGDSRLNSSEDIYNQALVNQYKSETNPNAIAQASRNSYVEYKNKTDMAKSVMNDTAVAAEQARVAYEEALAAAKASGSEEDQKIADRMKKNYELAQVEAENAKKQYEENSKNLPAYEIEYINKAIDSEKYKQEVYNAQMQKASADINTYEKQVNTQRRAVDAAGDAYIKAKSQASDNNPDSVRNAATKYNEYKAAKEVYDGYIKSLNLAKTSYSTAQSNYQASIAEVERLNKQLKEVKQ